MRRKIRVGDLVEIERGATVRSLHPKHHWRPYKSKRRVSVRVIHAEGDHVYWAGEARYQCWTNRQFATLIPA